MNVIWTVLAWLPVLAVLVPLAWFSLELALGMLPRRPVCSVAADTRVAVLIPAHNEALGVGETVACLLSIIPPGTRVLVVADNCTDATAEAARSAGAEVTERHDTARRGKGFALAHGRAVLAEGTPPQVVVVLDADCRLSQGSIEALAAAVSEGRGPGQAVYTFASRRDQSPLVQISNFAMLVKNLLRYRGMERIGGCGLLCGTGMGFAWPDFAAAPLATDDIVEDLGLGIEMVRHGRGPRLVDAAKVTSAPAAVSESVAQRSRWEHGFLATAMRHALPTIGNGLCRFDRAQIALGMHLIVPPLALLFLVACAVLALSAGLAAFTGYWVAVQALTAGVVLAGGLVMAAWAAAGRETLSLAALLRAPLYVLWKVPIYLGFLKGRQTTWVRTKREGE